MSDLKLSQPETGRPTTAILIALSALAAIAAVVFFANPRKTAQISVLGVQLFAPHTTFRNLQKPSLGLHVLGGPKAATEASEDDLYVIATLHIEDKLRLPLYLSGFRATMTTGEGGELPAKMIAAHDVERLEGVFPALASQIHQPLALDEDVPPGGVREGQVVLLFSGTTEAVWQSKKAAELTIELRNQNEQIIALP